MEEEKRERPRRKHWVFITFHYKGRKNTKKRLRQKVGWAAVRALSNLTPNCSVHVCSSQTSTAAECACWGRSQRGHREGGGTSHLHISEGLPSPWHSVSYYGVR